MDGRKVEIVAQFFLMFSLVQHKKLLIYQVGRTIDFIILKLCASIANVAPGSMILDRVFVNCKLTVTQPNVAVKSIKYHKFRGIDDAGFRKNLLD